MLDIVNGQANFGMSMYAAAFCVGGFGSSCNAESSFFTSARILASRVLDDNGNIVDVTVSSGSGFDYLTGIEPHSSGDVSLTPVPLPASLPLLLLGGFSLVALQRRTR